MVVYLASPYSHPDAAVREARFEQACAAAAHLMRLGYVVLSPIAHSHSIAVRNELPTDWAFWKKQDEELLKRCDAVVVLAIEGWEESKGVTAEIARATVRHLPIGMMWPGETGYTLEQPKPFGGEVLA